MTPQVSPRHLKGPPKFEGARLFFRIDIPRRPKDSQRHKKGTQKDAAGSLLMAFGSFRDDLLVCFPIPPPHNPAKEQPPGSQPDSAGCSDYSVPMPVAAVQKKKPRRNVSVGSLSDISPSLRFVNGLHNDGSVAQSVPSSPFAAMSIKNPNPLPHLDLAQASPGHMSGLDVMAAAAAEFSSSQSPDKQSLPTSHDVTTQPNTKQASPKKLLRRPTSLPASLNTLTSRDDVPRIEQSTRHELGLVQQDTTEQQPGAIEPGQPDVAPKPRRLVRRNASLPASLNSIVSRSDLGTTHLAAVPEGQACAPSPSRQHISIESLLTNNTEPPPVQEAPKRRIMRRNTSLPTSLNSITMRMDLGDNVPLSTVPEGAACSPQMTTGMPQQTPPPNPHTLGNLHGACYISMAAHCTVHYCPSRTDHLRITSYFRMNYDCAETTLCL